MGGLFSSSKPKEPEPRVQRNTYSTSSYSTSSYNEGYLRTSTRSTAQPATLTYNNKTYIPQGGIPPPEPQVLRRPATGSSYGNYSASSTYSRPQTPPTPTSHAYGVVVSNNWIELLPTTISTTTTSVRYVCNYALGTVVKVELYDSGNCKSATVHRKYDVYETVLGVVEVHKVVGTTQRLKVVGEGMTKPQVILSKAIHKFQSNSLVFAKALPLPFDYLATIVDDKVQLKRKGTGPVNMLDQDPSDDFLVLNVELLPKWMRAAIIHSGRESTEFNYEKAKLVIRDPYIAISDMMEYEEYRQVASLTLDDIPLILCGGTSLAILLTHSQFNTLFNSTRKGQLRIGECLSINSSVYPNFTIDAIILENVQSHGQYCLSLECKKYSEDVLKFYSKHLGEELENKFTISHGFTPSPTSKAIKEGFEKFYYGPHFTSWSGRSSNTEEPIYLSNDPILLKGIKLDASQQQAVRKATTLPGFTVISAPPGSGKTMVIGALCNTKWKINKKNEKRIVIGSSLNIAVTEAIYKVRDTSQLRVCRKFSPKLEYGLTDAEKTVSARAMAQDPRNRSYFSLNANDLFKRLEKLRASMQIKGRAKDDAHRLAQLKGLENSLEFHFIDGYQPQVLGSTLYYIWAKKITEDATHLILDESSRISAMEALALYCACPDLKFITVIGDSKQMPPYNEGLFSGVASQLVNLSEIERLEGLKTVNKCQLTFTYRSHPLLTTMLLQPLYGGNIKSGIKPSDRTLAVSRKLPVAANGTPCLFVQIGQQTGGASDKTNIHEKEAVLRLLETLKNKGVDMEDVLIIAHHLDQKELMVEAMKNKGTHGPMKLLARISTVDACQGIESPIVIVMTTKTCHSPKNAKNIMSFICEPHRETVAVSRAKEAIYLFGDWNHLLFLPFWSKFRENVIAGGALVNDNLQPIVLPPPPGQPSGNKASGDAQGPRRPVNNNKPKVVVDKTKTYVNKQHRRPYRPNNKKKGEDLSDQFGNMNI